MPASRCGHCKKETFFVLRGEGTKDDTTVDERYHDGQEITFWRIQECQQCKRPTLEEIVTTYELEIDNSNIGSMEPKSHQVSILYPTRTSLTNLPETIEKNCLEALKVQYTSPIACAIMVGRALEAICNYEKAPGRRLVDQLDHLANSDRFPITIAKMAHQIRHIRNLGAHVKDDEVTEEDVPIILGFLEIILEYLYDAPAKIAAVENRLKKSPV